MYDIGQQVVIVEGLPHECLLSVGLGSRTYRNMRMETHSIVGTRKQKHLTHMPDGVEMMRQLFQIKGTISGTVFWVPDISIMIPRPLCMFGKEHGHV